MTFPLIDIINSGSTSMPYQMSSEKLGELVLSSGWVVVNKSFLETAWLYLILINTNSCHSPFSGGACGEDGYLSSTSFGQL